MKASLVACLLAVASAVLLMACTQPEAVQAVTQSVTQCPAGCICSCEGASGGGGGEASAPSASGTGSGGASGSAGTSGSGPAPTCNLSAYTPGVWRQTLAQPSNGLGSGSGIVVDPTRPGRVYVAMSGASTNSDGVFRSDDCGASWVELGNLKTVQQVRLNPSNPLELYAGSGVGSASTNGFYYSNDGGVTWSDRSSWPTSVAQHYDVYSIAVDPSDFGHALVAFHYSGNNSYNASGIAETFDRGLTWKAHPPIAGWSGQTGCTVAFLGNSSTWLYGTQGAGFWRTTNSGASWTRVTTRNQTHGGNQVYRSASGVLYSGSAYAPMRSVDNGATWTALSGWSYGYYQGIAGDGTNLYAAKWGGGALNTGSEATGNATHTNGPNVPGGAFELTEVDPVNRIMYGSMNSGGVWAVRLP